MDEETKRKISKKLTGRKCSREHVENNRKGQIGKTKSNETKMKMSQSQKLAWIKRKNKMDLYPIVIKLNGPIEPIGKTETDTERLENLKLLTQLIDELLIDVHHVAEEQNRSEFSIKVAGQFAKRYLDDLEVWLEERNGK